MITINNYDEALSAALALYEWLTEEQERLTYRKAQQLREEIDAAAALAGEVVRLAPDYPKTNTH
ncbi:MAG: hypothetical protein GFH27_549283n397 [Chloroflexi bacterium AL-W]|nr:hypothetical protein [Chloroflexi bacterium AL-N1]NOK64482.1 hypothetical protein [Chloroflexi bacterium AL-N10]NOK75724.1 hypothetical protein [Chloroflexi bacterium AL-N5]NOK80518.1 hypothetical protein [Chloroflexi bacterium AL-W]NOK87032.1 hypothetical protein [Chloroflexi bacterium AL-N15]